MNTRQFNEIPTDQVLADNNIRFGLKPYRVKAMAASIIQLGGVQTPVKVTPLAKPGPNGEKFSLREGFYRLAGLLEANKEGADLLLPVEVVEVGAEAGVERLDYQLSENLDREDMSPMDMAVAIKKYLDAGLQKTEIAQKFVRPGGRKGSELKPISNSMLNIYVSFLEFPKKVQALIHAGIMPVTEGYKLSKQPKDKWDDIIKRVEAEREAAMAADSKLEEAYQAELAKAAEAEQKRLADEAALQAAEKLAIAAKEELEKRAAVAAQVQQKMLTETNPETKKKLGEEAATTMNAAKVAEKAAKEAQTTADKMKEKLEKAAAAVLERKRKLEAARKEADAKGKIKGGSVDKAGAAVGSNAGPVALTAAEMRKLIENNSLPGSFPKTQKIFESMGRAMKGELTEGQLLSEVAYYTGERKEKPKTVKDAAPGKAASAK